MVNKKVTSEWILGQDFLVVFWLPQWESFARLKSLVLISQRFRLNWSWMWSTNLSFKKISLVIVVTWEHYFKKNVFLLKNNWHTILYSFQVYNIVIWYLHTLWNGQHNKPSYYLSPYKVDTVLLTVLLYILLYYIYITIYITILYKHIPYVLPYSPCLIYVITGRLYLLIPFNYFMHPPIFIPL